MALKGFVLTMQYNDEYFMPIWVRHYEKYFKHESMYVIDHGSDYNFIPQTVNRIYVPRAKGFDELDRLSMVQGFVFALMKCYDWGVFCDSDELILLENFSPELMAPKQTVFSYGFDLFKVNVDGCVKVYGLFNRAISKPLVFNHDYPGWSTGFHGVKLDAPPEISLVMGHLKYFDEAAYEKNFCARKKAYDSMNEIEKSKGIAQQWNDQSHFANVYSHAQKVISDVPPITTLDQIPLGWGHEANGCTVLNSPDQHLVMDLTDKFKDLLANTK